MATLTVAQEPIMPTVVPISVSLGKKLEKFNGLNFKNMETEDVILPGYLESCEIID